jgi:SAM-dependent methyltransferase
VADAHVRAAVEGFDRVADVYEKVRPSYPGAVVDLLSATFRVGPESTVLDLAAGTGKLTRLLVPLAGRVVAVEPVAGMRAELAKAVPRAEVLDGTAEAIPLGDRSVDVVTVAQAFHWFDPDRALADIRRVLRDGGGLALVWNVRDESVAWVRDFTEVIVEGSGGRPYTPYNASSAGDAMTSGPLTTVTDHDFEPIGSWSFPNAIEATIDDVVARAASTSFVAALAHDRRARLLDEVRALLEQHPDLVGHERFAFPHDTEVYLWRAD